MLNCEDLWSLGALLSLSLVGLTAVLLWLTSRRPDGIPPGPPVRIPILGNLADLHPKYTLDKFKEYRKQYGDIFSLKMGSRITIVLNGFDTIKDVLVKHADVFSNRPDLYMFKEISKNKGLAVSSGALWKEHRTFALGTLRQLGFGKRSLEPAIKEEIMTCLKVLEETKGKPYDISNLIRTNISNVTCALVFGKRFEHNDQKFISLLKALEENIKVVGAAGLLNFLPFLKYIPGDFFKVKRTLENADMVLAFLKDLVKEHEDNFDEDDIRDYIDAYLKEARKKDREGDHTFQDDQLMMSIADLFIAGTETTATTIRWAILYFLHLPEVQEKMKTEIEQVVGPSRYPTMSDRSELTYCEAVITEVLRCGDIAPLAAPHTADRDVIYKGYKFPKGVVIVPNLDSILMDPDNFEEPEKFKPSRFIDKDGKLCGQEKVLVFSTGRRACLGEALARMELFLFITALVQRFKFLPEDEALPKFECELGATRAPNPFKFRAVLR